MDQFVSALLSVFPAGNCGCTVDWHRGNKDGTVVQWLWAAPVGLGAPSPEQIHDGIEELSSKTGFTPGKTDNFLVALPNSVETLDNCPFQPAVCKGNHIVASGSGRL